MHVLFPSSVSTVGWKLKSVCLCFRLRKFQLVSEYLINCIELPQLASHVAADGKRPC